MQPLHLKTGGLQKDFFLCLYFEQIASVKYLM